MSTERHEIRQLAIKVRKNFLDGTPPDPQEVQELAVRVDNWFEGEAQWRLRQDVEDKMREGLLRFGIDPTEVVQHDPAQRPVYAVLTEAVLKPMVWGS